MPTPFGATEPQPEEARQLGEVVRTIRSSLPYRINQFKTSELLHTGHHAGLNKILILLPGWENKAPNPETLYETTPSWDPI